MNVYVDLDRDSREALELDGVLEWIAGLTRTPMGAEAVRTLRPLADGEAVVEEIATVEQARRLIAGEGRLLGSRLPDPRAALDRLDVADTRLEAVALRDVAAMARAAGELRGYLLSLAEGAFDRLAALARPLPDLRDEADEVLAGVDSEGRLLDEASPELARLRAARRRVGERLQGRLWEMIRDPDAEPVIRDDFVTQRNGRYVIPVRTDTPRPVEGIVHAISSSGATRFVEPLETVELNNEIVRLAEQEKEEEERILRVWTETFRHHRLDLRGAVGTLARFDTLQARALFGDETGGVAPHVRPGGAISLRGVRHPLLERHLREQGGHAVPLDLSLQPFDRTLVLSGPNTGGKTVALKTIGLAALLAQSGIPVPARSAELPLYGQVRADIGDHQSIQADLSTWSAHVRAIVGFLDDAAPPALFLFDEIGTGTEPTEGAALAEAVLEALERPGLTAVATTHLAALKAWAFGHPRAECAAMEFDTETLRPTYHLQAGVAGTSAGLEIAQRLGLDRAIVDRARERLGPERRRAEGYLDRLRELVAAAETEREQQVEQGRELAERQRRAEERLEREAEKRRKEAGEALDRALAELRELGRRELAELRDARERARSERQQARGERRLAEAHRTLRDELVPDEGESRGDWITPADPVPGQQVWVRSLGRDGEILAVRGAQVEVRLGRLPFTVARSDLRVPPDGRVVPATPVTAPEGPRRVARNDLEAVSPRELMLLGRTVDEALDALDRFLDAALLAGLDEVRVVHGHGTGRLKAAVRRFLHGDRRVVSHRSGGKGEGGDGATVARLAA